MAKAAKKKNSGLPEGYTELEGGVAGYFVKKEGNTVEGRYLGWYESKSSKFGPKKVFQVEITNGATLIERDKKEMDASEGDVIGLNETGYLKSLLRAPEGSSVFIKCEGKEGPAKDDAWVFKVGVRASA